jgi:hypothetical protein
VSATEPFDDVQTAANPALRAHLDSAAHRADEALSQKNVFLMHV